MPRHLLVCSGGGHLKQLYTLASRIGICAEDQFWVTFDTGLSRSLLKGRNVAFAKYAAPRDVVNIVKNGRAARRLLQEFEFQSAISTGASLAVNYLPQAARLGIPSHYIESAARAGGPSVTGKILALDVKVHTYTQYPAWSSNRWKYRGSIFDEFEVGPVRDVRSVDRVVVTLGTTESYGFRRLIARLAPRLVGKDVLWQTGATDTTGLGIDGRRAVPANEMEAAVSQADLVIAHAGTGAALTALQHGKTPLLVPRRSVHREHIDDHQLQIANELASRGLAVAIDADALDETHLFAAASRSTRSAVRPPAFELDYSQLVAARERR